LYDNARMKNAGIVLGIVKPSNRPGRKEDLDPILPPGVRIVANHLEIYRGAPEELERSVDQYDAKVLELAAQGCSLVHPAGAPPLLLGYEGEQRRIERWEAASGVPVFTNGSSQVNALRAFGARRILGLSYFAPELNARFARYYREAGFEVLDLVGLEVPFPEVIRLPQATLQDFVRAQHARNAGAEALLLIGPAWRTMDLVEGWEADFGIPVVHHVQAQSWELQRRLGLRHPVQGWGRLVSELPLLRM
jgi:maleate cis-trans isomerase